jgi:cytochrome c5
MRFVYRSLAVALALAAALTLSACATPAAQQEDAKPAVSGGEPAATTVDDAGGDGLLQEKCTPCHTLARVDAVTQDFDGWLATIDRMVTNGAVVSDAEREMLATYLSTR